MTDNKIINATKISPEIQLDNNGSISISGKSMMEDASVFYNTVHDRLNDHLKNNKSLTIKFDLSYFNSSSAKHILKLLMSVDNADIK